MSLRLRLAIALAALAALAAVSVAVVSYVATTDRLHDEIDSSLRSSAQRYADPDHHLANAVCSGTRLPPDGDEQQVLPDSEATIVECVDASGTILGVSGPMTPFAIDHSDITHALKNGTVGPESETISGHPYRVMAVSAGPNQIVVLARSLESTDHVLDSIRNEAIFVGLLAVALAALVGVLLARRITAPMIRLTRAAENIAKTGTLEVPHIEGGTDEVGRLTIALSEMLSALQHSVEQQRRLVQDAGHELRTPLTSVRTNIDTLRRYNDLPHATLQQILSDLDLEIGELSAMVEELIALAMDRNDDEPMQDVDLALLVESIVERNRRRSGRQISLDAQPSIITTKPQLLTRAISNVIENALKFTQSDTNVEVTVRPGLIEIRDHGDGIPEQDIDHIFERFYRSDEARSRSGSGLGLAIVKQIVEQLDGTVSVTNHPENGAVFSFFFAGSQVAGDK